MPTALLIDDAALAHEVPQGHPERPDRLRAVRGALENGRFAGLRRLSFEEASDAALLRGHPRGYLDRLAAAAPASGLAQIDADTWMSPGSLRAARLGAGACLAAVDAVLEGAATHAFVAMRPPGHHAEAQTAMGFCFFGNVALAAKHALEVHGLSRVAVVDFDVHHGNGTQALLWDEPRALFVSTHQMPLWPGSGAPSERGAHDNVLNVPLPPGSDGGAFHAAMTETILPRLDAFAPQLVLVSAGFDAHRDDPLAQLEWEAEDFARATAMLCDVAARHAGGRVVSALEGGYDLPALAAGVAAHVGVLMERADG